MYPNTVSASDIIGTTVTSTGTIVTIPAGRWINAVVTLSGTINALAGTSFPTVSVSGAGASPSSGSVLLRLNLSGVVTGASSASASTEIIAKAPAGNDITLEFTAGATGTSSASINGFLI